MTRPDPDRVRKRIIKFWPPPREPSDDLRRLFFPTPHPNVADQSNQPRRSGRCMDYNIGASDGTAGQLDVDVEPQGRSVDGLGCRGRLSDCRGREDARQKGTFQSLDVEMGGWGCGGMTGTRAAGAGSATRQILGLQIPLCQGGSSSCPSSRPQGFFFFFFTFFSLFFRLHSAKTEYKITNSAIGLGERKSCPLSHTPRCCSRFH